MSWKEVEIGNLVELRQGLCINKKSNHLVAETGLPLLRITDMINNRHSVFIKEEVPEKYIAKNEDIIYSRTGQVGLVFRHQFGVLFNNCFTVAPNSDELSRDYLYWFLRCDDTKKMANDFASGAAQLDLSHSAFKCIKIKYPTDLPTQRRIASILSAYDDLIENNLKRIKLLEEKAFLRYKQIVREEELEEVSVFEYAEIMSGGTPSTTNPNYWEGEIPFFTPKDLSSQSGYYLNDTERKITELGLEKCNSRLFPRDTIFITARGTVGKLVLAKIPSAISQSNYAITTRNGSSNYFLFLALIDRIDHFKQLAVGGVFDTIIVDTFKMIFIELPNQTIIDHFNIEIKPIFQLIDTLQKQNTKLREARDILLPKLMNGQVEV